jgi:uncharacterized iron-regulated membrane protein
MNYDLHTGAIWGMPGKILYVVVALLGATFPATFPATGLYIWYRRRKRKQTGE